MGVFNRHALPGIFGGIVSIFGAFILKTYASEQKGDIFPEMMRGRDISIQASI